MGNIDRRKCNRDIDSWTLFVTSPYKRTAPRRKILQVFQKADHPLCAEDIFVVFTMKYNFATRAAPHG
jgi:Fe2+ or Zn2+ uptake regulation protein